MRLLLNNIPQELKAKHQWVGWARLSGRKVPMCPMTGLAAKSSDPNTWGSFREAVDVARQKNWDGVGFVFDKDYVGIDLDHCIEDGKLNAFAEDVLKSMVSYTELSPSKTGIHIIGKGEIPRSLKTKEIEIYNTGRYFTVTGCIVKGRRMIKPVDVNSYYTEEVTNTPSIVDQLGNMKPGNVDMTLTSLAGKLFKKGSAYEEVFMMLKPHANQAGHDDTALHRICKSVSRYHQGDDYGQHTRMERETEEERKAIEVFTPSRHAAEFIQHLEESTSGDTELLTGFPSIDSYTGGLKKGSVWVMGARTGIGKTSFGITVAEQLLKRGKKVLIFSTEMDWIDAFGRFASMGTGVSLHTLTNARGKLTAEDKGKLERYAEEFKFKPLYVVEEPEPSLRVVAEEISRIRPDVFIFDHIQRVANERDKRYLELAKFIKGLNTLCRRYDCAGIVNSQLNRIAEHEEPQLHHLKECGALEEEAHAVILLWGSVLSLDGKSWERIYSKVAKNRGPKGIVELGFNNVTAQFTEFNGEQI